MSPSSSSYQSGLCAVRYSEAYDDDYDDDDDIRYLHYVWHDLDVIVVVVCVDVSVSVPVSVGQGSVTRRPYTLVFFSTHYNEQI